MGVGCNEAIYGRKFYINYECVGKGTERVIAYTNEKLRKSLDRAIKIMGISIKEINGVLYKFDPVDTDKTLLELGIKDEAFIKIKLKSAFNSIS